MVEEISEEYLSKFPTIIRDALNSNLKYRQRFARNVKTEYKSLKVYRAIHRANEIDDDDFLCNIEEAKVYNITYKRESLELYAISVNEDPAQIVKALSIPNARRPALGVAEGWMRMEYGPADFREDATHHNWYLFQDVVNDLKNEFKVVDLERIVSSEESYELEKSGEIKDERIVFLG